MSDVERILRENGLTDKPAEFDSDIHSWRCSYPDQYGPCSCFAEVAAALTDWLAAREVEAGQQALRDAAIDADHLAAQRAWSLATFGPGSRLNGVLDHIRKELKEIEEDPTDVTEWVDVIILAFDGAWRAGWEPQQIIDAIKAKQARNEARSWPDWRTMSPDEAIEHIDEGGEQ